jgi:glycosyltransferase involved in cell wall biosynthesis
VSVAVTVVVPIYNVATYIDVCIETLCLQTLKAREILLIDDGSTDGSYERAEFWSSLDPTVRVIRKPNGGCASARMQGLREARGDYVAFVDSDDWVEPEMLSLLYESAVTEEADIAQGGWRRCYEDGKVVDELPRESHLHVRDDSDRQIGDRAGFLVRRPTIWRRLYKASFLRRGNIAFPTQFRFFDDVPFQFHSLLTANKISIVRETIYNYRCGRPGQDIAISDERLMATIGLSSYTLDLARSLQSPGAEEIALDIVLNNLFLTALRIDQKHRKQFVSGFLRELLVKTPRRLYGLLLRKLWSYDRERSLSLLRWGLRASFQR